jgi:flagellar basal-body rod protein FlgC
MGDFVKSLAIAATGLRAQSGRMRVIAENIANADSTAQQPGGDPYRRRIPTFSAEIDRSLESTVVKLGRIRADPSDFRSRYEPGHPAADPRGYVKYPNVDTLIETTDMRDAQRSYEANLNIVSATRRMIQRTLAILTS